MKRLVPLKENFDVTHRSPRNDTQPINYQGHRINPRLVRRQKAGASGRFSPEPLSRFLPKGRAGRGNSLGMASLVSLTNSRAPGLRCGFCLVPGSGVIASWGVQASGGGRAPLYLVSLQIKSTPLAESFNISKNWLALGGVVSSSQEGFLRYQNMVMYRK